MTTQNSTQKPSLNEIYLRIWEKQQDLSNSRWTIITFFMSVSFAIFGFSFQNSGISLDENIQRITSISIYWFSFILYSRYSGWSKFLRTYLSDMESLSEISLDIQKASDIKFRSGWNLFSVNKLLILFGIIYTAAVVIFWA